MPSYKFRVLLDHNEEEEIFRDIVIASHENFEIFYRAILTAFEFSGQELASFYVSNKEWDKGHEIALMDMEINDSLDAPSIMKETILSEMITSKNQRFILNYDFLRMWLFMIELVDQLEETVENPRLEMSVGEAPAEESKEMDFSGDMGMGSMDFGDDIDDIFSDMDDDDEEDYDDFENIDDLDI